MGYVSEISKSVLVTNFPEAQNVDSEFIYNFFTRDENIQGGATSVDQTSSVYTGDASVTVSQNGVDATYIVMPPTTTANNWLNSQAELREAQSKFTLPRYVKLKWDPPDLSDITAKFPGTTVLTTTIPVNLRDNLNRILYAEVLGNQMYSGLAMQDINVDNNFYREFSALRTILGSALRLTIDTSRLGSALRGESDPSLNTSERLVLNLNEVHSAEGLTALIEEFLPDSADGSITATPESKAELANLLVNYQAEGVTFVSAEEIQDHADVLDETRHVVQNVVVRNTLSADMVRRASLNVETPYADDLVLAKTEDAVGTPSTGVVGFFDTLQANARSEIGDTGTTTAQYGLQVRSNNIVHYTDLDEGYAFEDASRPDEEGPDYDRKGSPGNPPAIGIAGFLIDKKVSYNTTQQGNPAVNFSTEPLVVEIKNMSGETDPEVFGDSGSVFSTEIRDGNISYGGRGLYRVRTVYYVEMDAVNVQPEEDKVARVGVLIASRGTNFVEELAIDKLPPPPPQNLNFLYDYVNQNLIINWDFPVNPQRDIKKFRVWKRAHSRDEFSGEVFNKEVNQGCIKSLKLKLKQTY